MVIGVMVIGFIVGSYFVIVMDSNNEMVSMIFIVDELFEINFNLILILVIGLLININGFIILNVIGGISLLIY